MVPFSRKKSLFLIRLLVIIVMAYVMIFTPSSQLIQSLSYVFIAFYLFTNLVMAAIPSKHFSDVRIYYQIVCFDSLMIVAGIYLSGLVGTDLYLIYFLIICLTTLTASFKYLLINILLFAGIYGFYLYQSDMLTGPMAVSYSLRLPFIIVIAMFYGFIVYSLLKDKENKLRTTHEKLDQIIQATDVFFYSIDLAGCYLFVNQKLYSNYGYRDAKEMLGLPYSHFHSKEASESFLKHVHLVNQNRETVFYESYDETLKKWFSHTLSPIEDPAKDTVTGVSIVSKDITDRVEKEIELTKTVTLLRETRDQLIQKDKMSALGRMASGVAHEIRNPLEIIFMGVDYIESSLANDNPDLVEATDKIYTAIDRANKIVNDVLSFSRKSDFKLTDVDICTLMKDTLGLAEHKIRKSGVVLQCDFGTTRPAVRAESNMLGQVLLNLINNAVDAVKDRSEKQLTVSIYSQTIEQVGYKTGYRRADFFKVGDDVVVVEISDTGKGIPEDDLAKIFEPFFTTKATGEGTGLGLSLAHMIMDRIRGTIDVTSEVDVGTSFLVKLQPAGVNNRKEDHHDGTN
ncbi:MAG: PAS domain S-box protein [Desulfobacteraceae bacterium]|nr:PAS domain S-box protein [Desulfobacteraceae bacterium]MBC2755951.1 PAS domain S-box protein [Desulfobacteraceae bacterium]